MRISDWSSDVCSSDLAVASACGLVARRTTRWPRSRRPRPVRRTGRRASAERWRGADDQPSTAAGTAACARVAFMSAFIALFARELKLAARARTEWLMPPLFFVIVVTLFGFGVRPNDPPLAAFAPRILDRQ